MSELMIEEAEVNLVALSLALERAMIEHTSTSNDKLYATEPGMFPFWIEIHNSQKYILLRTHLLFSSDTDSNLRHDFCNSINLHFFIPSVAVQTIESEGPEEHRMEANYPIYYKDGVLTSHFIRLCRAFSSGMNQIQDQLDSDHQILVPLTKRNPA